MAPEHSPAAYLRIAATLRQRIDRGSLAPGAAIPSEAELRREFGVARETVRRALAELERDGLLVALPAKGRFVRGADTADRPLSPAEGARQIAAMLRDEVAALDDGVRFASEKEVGERFSVSRYTARQALADLEAAGVLIAVHGRGRFVRRSQPP